MEAIDVCYSNTKAGTYVQFLMPVHTCELSELNLYDKFLKENIHKDFEVLFKTFGMDFSTEMSYIVTKNENTYLAICLLGNTTDELENALSRIGVEKRSLHLV